jgi:hypothetical protein
MRFWYATLIGLALAAIIHVSFPSKANAQQSTYYTDKWGQPAGQAWTYGNQTFYTDSYGRPAGSAATNTPQPPAPLAMPYPQIIAPARIEPIRPIEPIQPLRLQ